MVCQTFSKQQREVKENIKKIKKLYLLVDYVKRTGTWQLDHTAYVLVHFVLIDFCLEYNSFYN